MGATVAEIVEIMNQLAPPLLAEEWDNVGLQVGAAQWDVEHIIVALDPSPGVIADAASRKADMVITHHPLIFRPLSSIDFATPTGRSIETAARGKMAVYSAHTNLDSVRGGLNDILAA